MAHKEIAPLRQPPPDFVAGSLHANEIGDRNIYIYLHTGQVMYVVDDEQWLIYKGHGWAKDCKHEAGAMVDHVADCYLDFLAEKQKVKPENDLETAALAKLTKQIGRRVDRIRSAQGVRNILKLVTMGSDGLTCQADELDRELLLLGCGNGVVDLKNGRLRPGKPSDMISKSTGIDYPTTPTEAVLFLQTLREMFPENPEIIDLLQIIFGSAITGLPAEFLAFFIGDGSNGKTRCVINPIRQAFGDYVTTVEPEVIIATGAKATPGGPSPHIAKLKDVRLGFISEFSEHDTLADKLVKAQTGEERMSGKASYAKTYTEFDPSHTLVITSNRIPKMPGDDDALWQRLIFIDFRIKFVDDPQASHERQKDRSRPSQIMKELPAILAWMVAGCLRWQAAGRKVDVPDCVRLNTEALRAEEDILGAWLLDCCVSDTAGILVFRIAYNSFDCWFRDNIGDNTPSKKWFGRHLKLKCKKKHTRTGPEYLGYRLRF
ncbi:hypothetical protein KAI46_14575 [bacterium]|nr:hypothetical protein [bacterium]